MWSVMIENKESQRNIGIDLLKIVAMFMITILHTLGHGGIVWNNKLSGLNYDIAWFLEVASFGAVNCYALASGYVGINTRIRYYKLVMLYLQLVFSSLLITLFFSIYQPQLVSIDRWMHALSPIYYGQYWYLTAYFGLFLFLPVVNAGLNTITSLQRKILFFTILTFLVLIPFFNKNDIFNFASGYSLIWLLILYVLGAILAKETLFQKLAWFVLCFIYLGLVIALFYLKIKGIYWVKYTSPLVVAYSIVLVILFSRLKIESKYFVKSIKYMSSLTLGIYIFHEHPFIRPFYVTGEALKYFNLDAFNFTFSILKFAMALFICGAIFDACRKWIFDKLNITNRLAKLPYLG